MARFILDLEGTVFVARNNNRKVRVDLGRTGLAIVLTPRRAIQLADELVDAAEGVGEVSTDEEGSDE